MITPDQESLTINQPHALPAIKVLEGLHSSSHGLSTAQAQQRLLVVGPNRLPEPPRDSLLKRFFKHFHDLLIYILLVAAAITALLGHFIDTGVILGVVLINAIIGFIQEGKAEQALQGIRRMLSARALLRRDGAWQDLPAEALVPGDLVRLKSGDRVPADLRLLECNGLRIEESALTGESVPSEKNSAPVAADAGVGDRFGMAYSGTMVTAGRGLGVITATGAATEIGRISQLIAEVETLATPLTRQMADFSKVLAAVIVGLAVMMFVTGWLLHEYSTAELFLAAIGFAVAAIPEGLPAILTITLALGVQRMAARNAITRRLNAVETLGSVTVICSDKTGTLTRNEMTVRHLYTCAGLYDVEGTGYAPDGRLSRNGQPLQLDDHADLLALIEVMAVANDAHLAEENGQWKVVGEPTEGALCTLGRKAGFHCEGHQRLASIPFESHNKFMATLEQLPDSGRRLLLKGAPDRLLQRCRWQLGADGSPQALDPAFWETRIEALSSQGLRVLAAARRDVPADQDAIKLNDVEQDMLFLGLVGIIDPPRPEAIEAIRRCHQAGIRVKMITGDHAGTARAIAGEMGFGNHARAISGAEIEAATDEQLQILAQDCDIFARTSPEHKLRLVKALQARGEVVAMTGDGVNDAPALKRADVGVAMGIKGTEATKEAADIVLADDNFSSITQAVAEGRTIYDNLRKAILFSLPTNGAQGLVLFVAVIFGLVLPLTPVQILWVNMVVAVTLALALAFEQAEPGVMRRPPRDPQAAIIDGGFLWRIAFVSLLIGGASLAVFEWQMAHGVALGTARSMTVNTLVIGQAFYLFNSRFLLASSLQLRLLFSNRIAWLAIAVLLGLQLLFIYAPFMQLWFGTAPLTLQHWLVSLLIGLLVFLIIEAEKAILRRRE
jgi:magnesium-transporting ATPase (P-type)